MCPTPGNIRPDRSAAFVELLISSLLAHGRVPECPLTAISSRWLTIINGILLNKSDEARLNPQNPSVA